MRYALIGLTLLLAGCASPEISELSENRVIIEGMGDWHGKEALALAVSACGVHGKRPALLYTKCNNMLTTTCQSKTYV